MSLLPDSTLTTVRAAVAEQRAAALAMDPQRLGTANERLSLALERVQRARAAERPPETFEVAAIQRELKINAELIARGQAAGGRAVQAIAEPAPLYGHNGVPVAAAPMPAKPIAAA